MKLLHISDLHYRTNYDTGSESSSYQSALQRMMPPLCKLDDCLEKLGEDTVKTLDGVLISGDLCDGGSSADYETLRIGLETRFPEIPLIITLGNHDDSTAFREGWLGEAPDSAPWHNITRIGDLSIIAFDNSDPKRHPSGIIDAERCKWLRQAMILERGRTRIIMTHHHLIPDQAVFPSCAIDMEFDRLLTEELPAAILCGHTHQLYRGFYKQIPYRTAMGLSFLGMDLEKSVLFLESYGCSIYQFENGKLAAERHEEMTLEKILGEVVF